MSKLPNLTKLLNSSKDNNTDGQAEAWAEGWAKAYPDLHQIAMKYLRRENSGHTLQPTALVNEAYLKISANDGTFNNRQHFFALAAKIMRQILVDHARRKNNGKRGGLKISFDEKYHISGQEAEGTDILILDEALTKLTKVDPRLSQIVELRYFGGLTLEEVSQVLELSQSTIKRDWTTAKLWLYSEIKKQRK